MGREACSQGSSWRTMIVLTIAEEKDEGVGRSGKRAGVEEQNG